MKSYLENKISTLKGDRAIWVIFFLFALISLVLIYSSSSALAYRTDTKPFLIMIRQGGYFVFGFLVILLFYRIPLLYYRRLTYYVFAFSVLLLLLPPILKELRSINFFGISLHPAELAKITTVLYLAKTIEDCKLDTFKEYALRILLPVGATVVLCMLGSMSAMIIICFITAIILFCAKVKTKFILLTIPIGIGLLAIAFSVHVLSDGKVFSRFSTFTQRIERFVDKDETDLTPEEIKKREQLNHQAKDAQEAIQLGGFRGRGPGNSLKRDSLPNSYDDYIYAIIVEEYGLLGGGFIIVLYIWFFFRCLRIAASCTRKFSLITVLGLSTLITMQAMLHIFVNIGLLPVTGQTLPLISRGGTSLVIMSSAFGIILAINRTIELKKLQTTTEEKEVKS